MWDTSVQDKKSNVWTEAALRAPKWPNDENKFVGFFTIHILLTPVWLVFILRYFSGHVFMTVNILVNKLDNCPVVHLGSGHKYDRGWGGRYLDGGLKQNDEFLLG